MKATLATLFATALLAGCAVHTPSGSIVVDPHVPVVTHGHVSHGGGGFCPPGQAKKGNC